MFCIGFCNRSFPSLSKANCFLPSSFLPEKSKSEVSDFLSPSIWFIVSSEEVSVRTLSSAPSSFSSDFIVLELSVFERFWASAEIFTLSVVSEFSFASSSRREKSFSESFLSFFTSFASLPAFFTASEASVFSFTSEAESFTATFVLPSDFSSIFLSESFESVFSAATSEVLSGSFSFSTWFSGLFSVFSAFSGSFTFLPFYFFTFKNPFTATLRLCSFSISTRDSRFRCYRDWWKNNGSYNRR